jgi:hypothetical protein
LRKDQQIKKEEEEAVSNANEQKNYHLFYLNHKRQVFIADNNIGQDEVIILVPINKCLNKYVVSYPYGSWYSRNMEFKARILRSKDITKYFESHYEDRLIFFYF